MEQYVIRMLRFNRKFKLRFKFQANKLRSSEQKTKKLANLVWLLNNAKNVCTNANYIMINGILSVLFQKALLQGY